MESNHQPIDYKSIALPDWATPASIYPNEWCFGAESNHRHGDFQSPALPTELPKQNIGDPEGARTLDLQRDRLAY